MLKTVFCGDFAPVRNYEPLVLSRGTDILGDFLSIVQSADVAFVNLEAPLCRSGAAIDKVGPNLRADPACVRVLAEAGFDVVGLANNHSLDYGASGLLETIEVCEQANLATCGTGRNLAEAQQPLFVERKGVRLAMIAVAESEFSIATAHSPGAAPLDPVDNVRQIHDAQAQADLVIVTIHGGNEYFPLPRPGLRKLCQFYIEQGAAMVICHHPHVPGAFEWHLDKPIVYSLGNFVFDTHDPRPEGWDLGYGVEVQIDCETHKIVSFEILPYRQSVGDGGIRLLEGAERDEFVAYIESLRAKLTDDIVYNAEWKAFCAKHKFALLRNYSPVSFRGLRRLAKILPLLSWLVPRHSINSRLNMIRCESHLELLRELLAQRYQG